MSMSLAVYNQTKQSIDQAFETQDTGLLEKETRFLLNSLVSDIPQNFSESVRFVGFRQTKLKESRKFLTENHKKIMRQVLEILKSENQEFKFVKLQFDRLFLDSTDEGYIDYEYDMSELVSAEQAAIIFGVSKQTVYKYLEKGLEYKELNNVKKIPKIAIELWKDPSIAFELQWIYQQNKIRKQTLEEKFELIQHEINEFEIHFGNTFENLYGNLTNAQIDELDEAIDVFDWKNYIKQKNSLLEKIKSKRKLNA